MHGYLQSNKRPQKRKHIVYFRPKTLNLAYITNVKCISWKRRGLSKVKFVFVIAMGLVALPVVYFTSSLLGAVIPSSEHQDFDDKAITVGLLGGPIHYDFLLPLDEITHKKFACSLFGKLWYIN